jgi:hypothetical protein
MRTPPIKISRKCLYNVLIISILNNFVKERDPGGLNPRCAASTSPLPLGEKDRVRGISVKY